MKPTQSNTDTEAGAFDTRMHIVACMDTMLAHCSLEELTVGSLCKTAHISRTTFYNHFYDKYEVYQWHLDYLYSKILSEWGRTCTFREANYRMLSEVKGLPWLYKAAASLSSSYALSEFARGRRYRDLVETLVYHRGLAMSDKLVFQVNALVEIEVVYVLKWLLEDMPLSIEELIDGFDEIVPQELLAVLNTISSESQSESPAPSV